MCSLPHAHHTSHGPDAIYNTHATQELGRQVVTHALSDAGLGCRHTSASRASVGPVPYTKRDNCQVHHHTSSGSHVSSIAALRGSTIGVGRKPGSCTASSLAAAAQRPPSLNAVSWSQGDCTSLAQPSSSSPSGMNGVAISPQAVSGSGGGASAAASLHGAPACPRPMARMQNNRRLSAAMGYDHSHEHTSASQISMAPELTSTSDLGRSVTGSWEGTVLRVQPVKFANTCVRVWLLCISEAAMLACLLVGPKDWLPRASLESCATC